MQRDPEEKILTIDIGGSRIKGTVLDIEGKIVKDYTRVTTPPGGDPQDVIEAISTLAKGLEPYSKVSVGFPGYVRNGIVHTAPNLSTEKWKGFNLATRLSATLGKPTRVLNDAD